MAKKTDVGKILRELCEKKEIRIIEAECCPDHIHMLVEIPESEVQIWESAFLVSRILCRYGREKC